MTHLQLVPAVADVECRPLCDHVEKRGLTWVCTLRQHDDDRAHVMAALR